jgi:hypothetical protein
MIEWVCDSCGERREHEDLSPPVGWSAVKLTISRRNKVDDGCLEWESDQITLCNKLSCSRESGEALTDKAAQLLRAAVDAHPKSAPLCSKCEQAL